METKEALQVLDQVCSQVSLPKAGHIQVQLAMDVLRKATEVKKENPSPKGQKKH